MEHGRRRSNGTNTLLYAPTRDRDIPRYSYYDVRPRRFVVRLRHGNIYIKNAQGKGAIVAIIHYDDPLVTEN